MPNEKSDERDPNSLFSWVPSMEKILLVSTLTSLLEQIKINDTNYDLRKKLIYQAMAAAATLGYPVGIKVEAAELDWPIVYIELPSGQVSWHMPQHDKGWDGHTTREKFNRIDAYRTMVEQAVSGSEGMDLSAV